MENKTTSRKKWIILAIIFAAIIVADCIIISSAIKGYEYVTAKYESWVEDLRKEAATQIKETEETEKVMTKEDLKKILEEEEAELDRIWAQNPPPKEIPED